MNGHYVDRFSLMHGIPHQHIWTFAGGLRQDARYTLCACPCDQGRIIAAVCNTENETLIDLNEIEIRLCQPLAALT